MAAFSRTMAGRVLLGLSIGVIAFTTLAPQAPRWLPFNPLCFACGERGVADVVLNILLFLPLGFAFRLLGNTAARATAAGFLVSAAIELLQLVVPGRDPSISDLVVNTAGTVLGVAAAGQLRLWLTPSRSVSSRLAIAGSVGAAAVMAASAWLYAPTYPPTQYFLQWTQDRGEHEVRYDGRVVRARIGELDVPDGPVGPNDSVRRLLERHAPIRVSAVAGKPTPAFAPLFGIADEDRRGILALAVDGTDLVIRAWNRSSALRMDLPTTRFRGLLAEFREGQAMEMTFERRGAGWCVELNGTRTCRRGASVADGWRLLFAGNSFSDGLLRLGGVSWVFLLALPFGFWVRPGRSLALGIAFFAFGLGIVPRVFGLEPTPLTDWMLALLGAVTGAVIAAMLRAWRMEPATGMEEGVRRAA